MNKIKLIATLLILILTISMTACNTKPNNVSDKIYDDVKKWSNFIYDKDKNKKRLTYDENVEICNFVTDNYRSSTKEEKELLDILLDLGASYTIYQNYLTEDTYEKYKNNVKRMKEKI